MNTYCFYMGNFLKYSYIWKEKGITRQLEGVMDSGEGFLKTEVIFFLTFFNLSITTDIRYYIRVSDVQHSGQTFK